MAVLSVTATQVPQLTTAAWDDTIRAKNAELMMGRNLHLVFGFISLIRVWFLIGSENADTSRY